MKSRNTKAAKLFFGLSIFFLLFAIYEYLTGCIGCAKIDLRYFFIALFIALVLYITDRKKQGK